MQQATRQTIFISHANPCDNDVARWLASKLSVLGYSVWVDVEKFKGAESIWRTIEPVLRNQARCMILLLSHSTYGDDGLIRQGVSQEIELALTLEKQHCRFVLPWIVDDLHFSKLPIQLHNRISISERNWSNALQQILQYLESLEISPSPDSGIGKDLLQRLLVSEDIGVSQRPAVYDLNRLENLKQPAKIFSIEDDPSFDSELITNNSYNGRRLSFHSLEGTSRLFGKGEPKAISLESSLENGIEQFSLSPNDVRRIVVELTKKALNAHLDSKGLAKHSRQNRSPIYFFNSITVPAAKIAVKLPDNSKNSFRNVWGKHKDIFWHLGLELLVTSSDINALTLSPHILFTKDSVNEPLDDDPKRDRSQQHRRRRAIAKLWFNDKWRGFYYPFLAFVSDPDGTITVPFKDNMPLVFSGTLATISVPVTHEGVDQLLPDDLIDTSEAELS